MIYTIYRIADGVVIKHVTCPPRYLARNTPAGCAAREGALDPLSQRIDPETLKVVELQREPPDRESHVKDLARETIARIEAGQIRAIREALLGDETAIERLREQEPELAAARAALQRVRP
jgi:hypothetical protein